MALMPYFLLWGLQRFSDWITQRLKKVLLVGFVVCVVVQQAIWFALGTSSTIYGWSLRLSMGLIISAFLRTHTWHNRFLIRIGCHAYGIYLFHAFGSSGGVSSSK